MAWFTLVAPQQVSSLAYNHWTRLCVKSSRGLGRNCAWRMSLAGLAGAFLGGPQFPRISPPRSSPACCKWRRLCLPRSIEIGGVRPTNNGFLPHATRPNEWAVSSVSSVPFFLQFLQFLLSPLQNRSSINKWENPFTNEIAPAVRLSERTL